MKFGILIAMLVLMGMAFATSGDCTKFGYNNTTTACIGGTSGNGTFNGNVSAVTFYGNLAYSYITGAPAFIYNVTKGFGFNNTGVITSNSTLNINTSVIQHRFGASCTTGIGYVDEDGTVHCSVSQTVGFYNSSQSDARYPQNGSSVNFTTIYGSNITAANSNANVNASYVQNAPWASPGTATCTGTSVAQNVTTTTTGTTSQCVTPLVYNNGTVTNITAGTGLTGGAITGSGTIALNTTYTNGLYTNITAGTATCSGVTVAQNYTITAGSAPTSQCLTIPVYNNGTVTSVTCGTGLTGGAITGSGTCALNTTYTGGLYTNITAGSCSANQYMTAIAAGTAPTCTALPVYNNGSVTGVTAGDTTITIGGTAAAPTVAANLTTLNTKYTNITAGSCSAGNYMSTIAAGSAPSCTALPVYNNGTVTSVTCNGGLTGGAITGSGTCALNTTGVSAGTYGGAAQSATIVIDTNGRITSATNTSISVTTPYQSSAAGWTNTSTLTSTTMNVSSSQGFIINTTDAIPTCAAALRGQLWVVQGAGGATDLLKACLKNSSNSYNWVLVSRGD